MKNLLKKFLIFCNTFNRNEPIIETTKPIERYKEEGLNKNIDMIREIKKRKRRSMKVLPNDYFFQKIQ